MIQTQRTEKGVLFFMPLCPSTNDRMRPVRMGRFVREILTAEARGYIQNIGTALRWWAKANKWVAKNDYSYVDLWFILPRTNCDASNYGKVLYDTLQVGGIVENDKYILPRIQGIWWDTKNTSAIVHVQNSIISGQPMIGSKR